MISRKFISIMVVAATFVLLSASVSRLHAQNSIFSGAVKFVPDSTFISGLRENSKISSIKCKFKETKHISLLNNTAVSYGNFTYNNGDIKLEYTNPAGNSIQIENGEFLIVNNGRRQSVSMNANPLMRQMAGMLSASMSGDIEKFGKESDIEYFHSDKEYIVTIVPSEKRTSRYLKQIIFIFNKKDMTLDSLYMFEDEENYTHYTFTNKNITK